jgi:FAD/FMN-containing dehydrogenase
MQLSPTISIEELRPQFKGRVIAPDDPDYDDARSVFYGGVDRRPAGIVRVADAADVSRAVLLARETGLELAVRCGGHSIAVHGVNDGGIVIHLGNLRALDIDLDRRTAWAQTGLTAGEYTNAVGAHGLATGFGDAASVGIGGITLGGGIGFLARKHGLTIDNLLAADIVTADGQVLRANAESDPDLFWAIRGGGGNFGVATRFLFQLQEVGTIVGGTLMLPATADVICKFVELAEAAPEELTTIANVMPAPPAPFVPAEKQGQLVIMALMVYAGDVAAGQKAIAPFRALAAPVADMVKPMPYPEIYPPMEEDYHPVVAIRSLFADRIDRPAAELIMERLSNSTATMRVAQVRVLGGAMARISDDATAYAHRGQRMMVNIVAMFERPEQTAEHQAWADDFAGAMSQGNDGAYVNFLADEGEARIRTAYPGQCWDRLVSVKNRYDPDNLFRLNHNIPPKAS